MCLWGPEFFWWSGVWVFPIMMMLIFAFVLYLIFGQSRFRRRWEGGFGNESSGHFETSLDIIKKRYAKGEINKEELEEIKRELLT
jgi:putative membrane protein